jgi:hypothetical protein
MRGIQFNLEFGYQLSICSKDRGKLLKTSVELIKLLKKTMALKNSVRTSKRTQLVIVTNIRWLMMFKEVIAI